MMLLLLAPAAAGALSLVIQVIVALIVIGVLFWAVRALSAAFGIPEPIRTVILVILVLMVLLFLLYFLMGGGLAMR